MRYLVARYPVPTFMDYAWFLPEQELATQQQGWYITVALDAREGTVTQARGRCNALPNRRTHNAKLRAAAQSGYLELLSRADHILRVWIDRERLKRRS